MFFEEIIKYKKRRLLRCAWIS